MGEKDGETGDITHGICEECMLMILNQTEEGNYGDDICTMSK